MLYVAYVYVLFPEHSLFVSTVTLDIHVEVRSVQSGLGSITRTLSEALLSYYIPANHEASPVTLLAPYFSFGYFSIRALFIF